MEISLAPERLGFRQRLEASSTFPDRAQNLNITVTGERELQNIPRYDA